MTTAIDLVIFGAQGDLSARKLFPALWHLDFCDLLEADVRILALSRDEQSSEEFLQYQKQELQKYVDHSAGARRYGSALLNAANT